MAGGTSGDIASGDAESDGYAALAGDAHEQAEHRRWARRRQPSWADEKETETSGPPQLSNSKSRDAATSVPHAELWESGSGNPGEQRRPVEPPANRRLDLRSLPPTQSSNLRTDDLIEDDRTDET